MSGSGVKGKTFLGSVVPGFGCFKCVLPGVLFRVMTQRSGGLVLPRTRALSCCSFFSLFAAT